MVYKMNESIIVIQAEATSPNRTNVVFWSHDRGTAKLRMKLVRKNGIPQSLPEGTTVPIRLMFKSATAEGGYGKHDYLATIEDPVNGIVSIVLEDNILGYVGTVEGSVYIDFPNDRSLDTAGRFTFYIKRSPIDDSTPELEDYFINGFSQTIDKIEKIIADGKQEIDQKIAESETQIDAKLKDTSNKITKANQDVATINTNIDKANDRIDQTNQQIGDLGKLKKMYGNSIDFGGYDYSGNKNLFRNIGSDELSLDFNKYTKPSNVSFVNGEYIIDTTSLTGNQGYYFINIPRGHVGKRYTYSIEARADVDTGGIAIRPVVYVGASLSVVTPTAVNSLTTANRRYNLVTNPLTEVQVNSEVQALQIYVTKAQVTASKIYIKPNIKLEEGSTATPYQPNLLDEPYCLSKAPLGENIANKDVQFPITTTEYSVYSKANVEDYKVNQKYVLTMKATKPATQRFIAYLNGGTIKAADLYPVEGLTDTWQGEFTVTQASIDAGALRTLAVYQFPSETKGTVKIDWLKIEKGDTRTPNISQFKYFGEGLKDSNNPNDYSWDVTPEYTEKGLNNTVSLTEPQSVEGLKNFEDGLQIAGKEVATVAESTGWLALTLVDGFEVAENNPPQYKITYQANGDNEIEFRGEFQLTGGTKFTKDTSYYPFGRANQATNIPNELKPDRTAFGYGATSTGVGGRLAVTTTPNFVFIPGDSDGTYCSISPLRYTQTKK
ncbi:BppU family phage baseplate upper protein [Enterococcus faecium]|uniref:BppU family phage baseplate upper protein n=1 Tax=Enterococcus faecium TaxID=1352 RepID=UPI002090C773|nr:BppU family phage baseplate upper protein [Enterococcus faecium]MCO5426621.1 BppU family phage baseplate upper protein [Enterococcus faecium]MCO5520714.1 BppU family phage baseplate upper protein [Enterococcus faecium]